jgi:hypothetical protein
MPLQRGEVRGYDFNRMILEFTMLNQGKVAEFGSVVAIVNRPETAGLPILR